MCGFKECFFEKNDFVLFIKSSIGGLERKAFV